MRVMIHSFGLMLLTLAAAFAQTNRPAPAVDIVKADECVTRLDELVDKVEQIDRRMEDGRQNSATECVRVRLAKIRAVREMALTARRWLTDAATGKHDNAALAADEYARITLACERAAQLVTEAEQCAARNAPAPDAPPKIKTPVVRPSSLTIRREAAPVSRRTTERTRQTCLRQSALACLAASAMNHTAAAEKGGSACTDALTASGITPLEGWDADRCATVDDLCVVLARVMQVNVPKSIDPADYWQALRDQGVAVDAILPERIPKEPSPLLLEDEARALLSTGFAPPLTPRRP